MLKKTRILTIINCILSGTAWLSMMIVASIPNWANFGTVLLLMFFMICFAIFEIIVFCWSLACREKENKYLTLNSILIVVTVFMMLVLI